MNAEKFTPGPWEVANGTDVYPKDDLDARFFIADCDPDNASVQKMEPGEHPDTDMTYEMAKANARLIAAAPDYHILVEDALPILEAVLDDREAVNGEEDEILRDLLNRCRDLVVKVNGGAQS